VRRRLAAAGVALLASLSLAACGLVPHSTAYKPPDPTGTPVAGGTLRVGIGQPQGIAPADAYEPYGRMITQLICEPLVSADPITGEIKSALASSWHFSDNDSTLYVTLRHGLHFANGDELTSASVTHSVELLASPDYQSYLTALASNISGYANFHSPKQGERPANLLTGARVIDKWSLAFQLGQRDPGFLQILADLAFAPVDTAAQQRDPAGFAVDPVCLGPYRLAAPWSPTTSVIRLVRNSAYTADDSAYTSNGAGYPDEIDFHVYKDSAAQLAAYDAGEIDVATSPGDTVTALLAKYGAQLQTSAGTQLDLVAFPTAQPPFDNQAVRVALSQAINRTALAAQAYGGGRLPLTGLLPPSIDTTRYGSSACTTAPVNGDAAAARATLAAAKVDLSGKTINLYFNDEFGHRAVAEQLAVQWHDALGVTVKTHSMTWDNYVRAASTGSSFDGPFLQSWEQLPNRESDYLVPLLTQSGLGSGNLSRFESPAIGVLAAKLSHDISDESGQQLLLYQLEQQGCQQVPQTPVTMQPVAMLVNPKRVASARPVVLAKDGALLVRELYVPNTASSSSASTSGAG
jgi:ABC-type oligopeptide transport system substrate-binding subunit